MALKKWEEELACKLQSPWFPVVHESARGINAWKHVDERFPEGRRRHILEEFNKIVAFNKAKASMHVVGAGFIGVEWVMELQYFFPNLDLTIIDMLPKYLGPLPDEYEDGDLEFSVWDEDTGKNPDFLGKVVLENKDFENSGFNKTLKLVDAKTDDAFLNVKLKVGGQDYPEDPVHQFTVKVEKDDSKPLGLDADETDGKYLHVIKVKKAATYCENYMADVRIKYIWKIAFSKNSEDFWERSSCRRTRSARTGCTITEVYNVG